MDDHEAKAQSFLAQADAMVQAPYFKVRSKWKGALRPLSKRTTEQARTPQNNHQSDEKAALLYRKAGTHFKMAKNWSSAGHAFLQSGTHREIPYDSCTDHAEAANCFKKVEPEKATDCLNKAAEIQRDNGKFQLAAKYHEEIGNIFESMGKSGKAVENYEIAAQYFRSELRNAAANKCILKAAEYAAMMDDYEKAIKIYEELAPIALESNLLKYSAEDHYFRAGICHLCIDFLNAQHALIRYCDEFPAFKDSRKAKLLEVLIHCVEETDIDQFEIEIDKYESVIKFDTWYKKLLNKVKNNMLVCGYDLM